jgi:hypothetical protein
VVEAQDEEHGIVGWKVVSYPADDAHSRTSASGGDHRGCDDRFGPLVLDPVG